MNLGGSEIRSDSSNRIFRAPEKSAIGRKSPSPLPIPCNIGLDGIGVVDLGVGNLYPRREVVL